MIALVEAKKRTRKRQEGNFAVNRKLQKRSRREYGEKSEKRKTELWCDLASNSTEGKYS